MACYLNRVEKRDYYNKCLENQISFLFLYISEKSENFVVCGYLAMLFVGGTFFTVFCYFQLSSAKQEFFASSYKPSIIQIIMEYKNV